MICSCTVNEPSCAQSNVVVSFVSSLLTAIIVITISIAIYTGVWFYRQSHPNKVPAHQAPQGSSNEGVYETVDDKAAATMRMTADEAYATTTT